MSTFMSITQALTEVKLLDKRIAKTIANTTFITTKVKTSDKVLNGRMTAEEFKKKANEALQSVKDLIERRKLIKSLIVESNAKTMVTIAGKQYTVADAIERKSSIVLEKQLIDELKSQFKSETYRLEKYNQGIVEHATAMKHGILGGSDNKAISPSIATTAQDVYTNHIENNSMEFVDGFNIVDTISAMQQEVEDFLNEVDYILSESNVITKIEIQD